MSGPHAPQRILTLDVAKGLGIVLVVLGSWIWVAAWNSEIRNPTRRAVRSTGAATFAPSIIVWAAIWVTSASDTANHPRRRNRQGLW